ncbi:MAG: hypothetical protein ACLQO6_16810 [Desulfomonilaceae bacterium]
MAAQQRVIEDKASMSRDAIHPRESAVRIDSSDLVSTTNRVGYPEQTSSFRSYIDSSFLIDFGGNLISEYRI